MMPIQNVYKKKEKKKNVTRGETNECKIKLKYAKKKKKKERKFNY